MLINDILTCENSLLESQHEAHVEPPMACTHRRPARPGRRSVAGGDHGQHPAGDRAAARPTPARPPKPAGRRRDSQQRVVLDDFLSVPQITDNDLSA
jgi:hypothetical protein